ncbi:polycystin-2 [Drosophila eugracilis]|uniref:polycystin-2 n=1 Tax=Drosophila eugracilis TaxID=29029 RepID=UPI0007E89A7D|nr:polycystin-2 [Drosophila eugracilis]
MTEKSSNVIFYITLGIMVGCGICIWKFSGFSHDVAKFNMILVAFLAVIMVQTLLFTPVKFTAIAIDAAFWPTQQEPLTPDPNATVGTQMNALRLQLKSLKSKLLITERHRNERVNLKYRLIKKDIFLTGKLFLILFVMVLLMFNESLFYNTQTTRDLFEYDHKKTIGLRSLIDVNDLYTFLEYSLVMAFTDEANTVGGFPWTHVEGTRMLGVVRLRQIRTEDYHMGLRAPVFTQADFSESWKLPYERVPYTDKYWPIYMPWISIAPTLRDTLTMTIVHHGKFINYPEKIGYVTLLSDTRTKSKLILQYLLQKRWLDSNTTALFMDFSLYNVDSNTFSVCTLWVEQFPFRGVKHHLEVESHVFVEQLRDITLFGMLMLFVTFFEWLQFAKAFFVKVWYEPRLLKTPWIMVDAVILILSMSVVIITAFRDYLSQKMIRKVEISVMVEFVDFREPSRLSHFSNVVKGFTVALVTLRLWKALQFSPTFQLFTKTIFLAWQALIWTLVISIIFIAAISISTVTINGNNTYSFSDMSKGLVTVTCFAFGYTNIVTPEELFHGGKWLGIILYVIMGFLVEYMLVNLIVSMLRDQMVSIKSKKDSQQGQRLSFWEFLRVEHAGFLNFILKMFKIKTSYSSKNRTVAQNIEQNLKNIEEKSMGTLKIKGYTETTTRPSGKVLQLRYRERIERTLAVAAILHAQMDLIERLMFGDEDGNLPKMDEDKEPASTPSSIK